MGGITSYRAGLAAEEIVAEHYRRAGMPPEARRWRGKAGEIDIVVRNGEGLVFVEVKKSKTHARAAEALSARQVSRIYSAGSEYLAAGGLSLDSEVRFDVALVDAQGQVDILENAICA